MKNQEYDLIQLVREVPPGRGGIERIAYYTDKYLHQNTKIITICLPKPKDKSQDKNILKISERLLVIDSIEYFKIRLPSKLNSCFLLIKYILNAKVLLLHQPDPLGLLIVLAVKILRLNAKIFIYWHSDPTQSQSIENIIKPLVRCVMRMVDRLIVTSPKLLQESPYLVNLNIHSVVVPCTASPLNQQISLDISDCISQKQLKLRKNNKTVVYVGRLVDYKNLPYMIQEFYGSNALELIIIGSGPMRFELEDINRKKNLNKTSKKVKFIGDAGEEEKARLIADSIVLILPSRYKTEAFGIVQIEAFSLGVPVISHNIYASGVSWVNLDHETGFVLGAAGSPGEMKNAINKILEFDIPQLYHYGKNCIARYNVFGLAEFEKKIKLACELTIEL